MFLFLFIFCILTKIIVVFGLQVTLVTILYETQLTTDVLKR